MGYRLHSAKVYHVEYSPNEFFNWATEVNSIIADLCENAWYDDDDDATFAKHLQVPKKEFEAMIKRLEEMSEDAYEENYGSLGTEMPDKDYLIQGFKSLLEDADKQNDYIYLAWF